MDLEATSSAAKEAFGKPKKMAAEKKRSKRFIFVAIIMTLFLPGDCLGESRKSGENANQCHMCRVFSIS